MLVVSGMYFGSKENLANILRVYCGSHHCGAIFPTAILQGLFLKIFGIAMEVYNEAVGN